MTPGNGHHALHNWIFRKTSGLHEFDIWKKTRYNIPFFSHSYLDFLVLHSYFVYTTVSYYLIYVLYRVVSKFCWSWFVQKWIRLILVVYMKEGSRSLIGVEFGRCYVIILQHRMRLDCELVDVFSFLVNFCYVLFDVCHKKIVVNCHFHFVLC